MADKDWLTSQLINETSLGNLFAESSPISVSIPPLSTHVFTVTLAGVVAGDPVSVSPDATLTSSVGMFFRGVTDGVEITLRNFSSSLSASLSGITFKVAAFKET